MTTHDALLARALKRANEAVVEHPDRPEARASTVAALQAAIAQGATKAPPPRARWPLALAAGVSVLLGGSLWWGTRPATVARVVASGGALTVGQAFADATLVESGEGELVLALPREVRVSLQPKSALQLQDQGARVVVQRGEVAAEVTALAQPFVLEAGDTVVATRAARLRVSPGAGCDGRTRVEVHEGSALVNATITVRAGEAWPRCEAALGPSGLSAGAGQVEGADASGAVSAPSAAGAGANSPGAGGRTPSSASAAPREEGSSLGAGTAASRAGAPGLGSAAGTPSSASAVPSSRGGADGTPSPRSGAGSAPSSASAAVGGSGSASAAPAPRAGAPTPPLPDARHDERLARQNELYLQAVNLHRAGDVNGAVRKLDVILEDERSPLGEAALAHKMKWLSETNRAAARQAARQYLQRFPMGFGRADAETLVLETP